MQQSNQPTKIQLPFANSGQKNAIPVPSQTSTTPGAASYTDGFPPLTMTAISAGGIPPSGKDFNGILNAITAILQWECGGGFFTYDSAWSSANGGYPKGAVLQSAGGNDLWLNETDSNTTNPDATDGSAANWVSLASYGIGAVTGLTNVNVTLTPAQYSKRIITLAGALTGNVQIIVPNSQREYVFVNNTTGAYTVTCKTAAGTGVAIPQGSNCVVYGDGTNINLVSTPGRLIGVQTFTANGTYTPTPGTNSVIVELVGGGGGSGGVPATGAGVTGLSPAGSGGAYAKARYTSGFSGVAVTVGAVGAAGAAGAAGGNGGTSSFGALLSCPGGNGSQAGSVSSGALSIASAAVPSALAGTGIIESNLGIQQNNAIQVSAGNVSSTQSMASNMPGTLYGAGASGAFQPASTSAIGGNPGRQGLVIVWEYA